MAFTKQNFFQREVALAAGDQTVKSILDSLMPSMTHGLVSYDITVISGGPVGFKDSEMSAVADGTQYNPGDSWGDRAHGRTQGSLIPANRLHLYPTTPGDVVRIICRCP